MFCRRKCVCLFAIHCELGGLWMIGRGSLVGSWLVVRDKM